MIDFVIIIDPLRNRQQQSNCRLFYKMDYVPSLLTSDFSFSQGYVVGKMTKNTCDDEQIIDVGCGKFTYEVGIGYEGKGSKNPL